ALEALGLAAPVRRLFRRLQADGLALDAAWRTASASHRLVAMHALRIAAIHRIWLLAARLPDFSPRHGVTRAALVARILRLDVPAAVDLLEEVFPSRPDPAAAMDFGEPAGPREAATYEAEHAEILAPMRRWFALVREGSAAIAHEVGSFG
ncbi:phosphoenolpyruvate carboxylase, partial [Elioraea sp. Yellowstone]